MNGGNEKANEYEDDLNDENQEEILSVEDFIKINESLEREAEELLGGQNDNVCTYPEGYKYRQPLYSCRTCATESDGQLAGVCYACSGNCHEGHDLVELYTKRKFCCDCGNSKFKSKCKLYEDKIPVNLLNKYNDNFNGIYCVCKMAYPPTSDDENVDGGEMHQCCVCEDWFHLSHIFEEHIVDKVIEKIQTESADESCELACKDCVGKLSFLIYYGVKFFEKEDSVQSLSNTATDNLKKTTESFECHELKAGNTIENNVNEVDTVTTPTTNLDAEKGSDNCRLELLKTKRTSEESLPRSIYLESGWRDKLCRCTNCMNMYEDMDCVFFVDKEDTFAHYEAERLRNTQNCSAINSDDVGDIALQSAGEKHKLGGDMENLMYNIVVKKTNNRDAALNAYMGVKEMYSHLGEFFAKHSNGRIITRDDVQQCFEELKAKRPRFSAPSTDDDAPWTQ